MSLLLIDAETYSTVDLTVVGGHQYAKHPDTEVILWSVRDPEWPATLVFEDSNIWHVLSLLKRTNRIQWTRNEPLYVVSWGAFDRLLAQHTPLVSATKDSEWTYGGIVLGPNNTEWIDLMEVSRIFGGPAELKHAAKWWAPNAAGKIEGKGLISLFCQPDRYGNRTMPEDEPVRWAEFKAYAARDTEVMVPILERFEALTGVDSITDHQEAMGVVRTMNERGIPVNRTAAAIALAALDAKALTVSKDIEVRYGFKPSQVHDVREFLGTEDCKKDTLETLLDHPQCPSDKAEVIGARLLTSGAARKKLNPMLAHSDNDEPVVKDVFVYAGAKTRRLASRGIQGQNFVRSPSDPKFFAKLEKGQDFGDDLFDLVRSNIRGFIKAPKGYRFISADYSAIEARVAAWLAGEVNLLDGFRNGRDVYVEMAESLSTKSRALGKTMVLGAGFGGRYALLAQCLAAGVDIDMDGVSAAVDIYRARNPNIVAAWGYCEDAMSQLVDPDSVGEALGWSFIEFHRHEEHIRLVRPSGFSQYFWLPQWLAGTWPSGDPKIDIGFVGKQKSGAMGLLRTYGADTFQGAVQGIAADLIIAGMKRAEDRGYPLVMSIHDEVVALVPEGQGSVEELCEILCDEQDECYEGLPLKAEGWEGPLFTK